MKNEKRDNFNYDPTYYKVTNREERHYGYQYHDGLNILQEEFNSDPNASCVPGGLYFTNYEHLPAYLHLGTYIREVTIPEDAQVVLDPTGDKWRADKIILGNKVWIKKDFEKWFNKEKYNYKTYSHILASKFPDKFNLWFDPEKYNWSASYCLPIYCSDKFDLWFDPDKYNWRLGVFDLAKYCSDKFEKWFDPERIYLGHIEVNYWIKKYCKKHKHIWGEYISI